MPTTEGGTDSPGTIAADGEAAASRAPGSVFVVFVFLDVFVFFVSVEWPGAEGAP